MARGGRSSRRWLRVAAGVVVVLAVVAAGYPVVVEPQLDPVGRADAVVVLGGSDEDGRAELGLELVRSGVAAELVLSDPYQSSATATARACRTQEPGITVTCFAPDPATTLGEARRIRDLASERGWSSVVVVTGVYHVSRARWIISRCFPGELTMTAPAQRPSLAGWTFQYVYQGLGYARAALRSEC